MRSLTILLGMRNAPDTMMAKPVKIPELHYPMMHFLTVKILSFPLLSLSYYSMQRFDNFGVVTHYVLKLVILSIKTDSMSLVSGNQFCPNQENSFKIY